MDNIGPSQKGEFIIGSQRSNKKTEIIGPFQDLYIFQVTVRSSKKIRQAVFTNGLRLRKINSIH